MRKTDHVMYDLWTMTAQSSHSLKYIHLLTVLETLPDTADSNVQSALTNPITGITTLLLTDTDLFTLTITTKFL